MHSHSHMEIWNQRYGYAGVLVIFLTEMLGAPFPAETTLTLVGIELSRGLLRFWPVWFVATAGNIIGSSVSYWLGYRFGHPVITRFGRYVGLTTRRFTALEQRFLRQTAGLVLVGKFVSIVRVLVPLIAGISRMRFVTFTLLNSISAAVWAATFILEGKYLGVAGATVSHRLGRPVVLAAVAILVAAGILWRLWRWQRRRNEKHQ